MPKDDFDVLDYGGDSLDLSLADHDSGLADLSKLVKQLAMKRVERAEAEERLKQLKSEEEELARVRIPDLFEELGLGPGTEISTDTGLKVKLEKHVKANITDAHRDAAVRWFEENNLDRLLKDEFSMKLSKGEADKAESIREMLNEIGVAYTNKRNVPWNTLAKFVKERDAAGEPVPDDLLGVYRYNEAKIG